MPNIPPNARWQCKATTVAGGNGFGNATNQIYEPFGLCVDDNETVIVADTQNHRIVQWKKCDVDGEVVAGGKGAGKKRSQLDSPIDVWIDRDTNSLIICDSMNRRIVRWSRRCGTKRGKVLIRNIQGARFTMDCLRYCYVSDSEKHEVKRYQLGTKQCKVIAGRDGQVIAGGHGRGNALHQLNMPRNCFVVDQQNNILVLDKDNHRVVKWSTTAREHTCVPGEGIVVAGGQGLGRTLMQLKWPHSMVVDSCGTLYIADTDNHRILRWYPGDLNGTIIAGGNGEGHRADQLCYPTALCFDQNNNLYVADSRNHRVQRFAFQACCL